MNIIPMQAAQASIAEDKLPLQPEQSYDEQQLQKYLLNLKINTGSINGIIATQTLSVAKFFQTQDSSNADSMPGEQTAGALKNQAEQAPAATPSRGDISRSSQDLDYLAHTIYGEARGESFEGKVAVAAVVLNRADSGQFGNSIREVIFQMGAFSAVSDGQYYLQPDDASYEAAREALNGWDPTNGAIYFWNPNTATDGWVYTRTVIKTIGNHVFAV
jgi:N-acetylmuramoyl-L-alanine amidase